MDIPQKLSDHFRQEHETETDQVNASPKSMISDPPIALIDPLKHYKLLSLRQANRTWKQGHGVPCEEKLQTADRTETCDLIYHYSPTDLPGRIQAQLLCQILKQKFNNKPSPSIQLGVLGKQVETFSGFVNQYLVPCLMNNYNIHVFIYSESEPLLETAITILTEKYPKLVLGIGKCSSLFQTYEAYKNIKFIGDKAFRKLKKADFLSLKSLEHIGNHAFMLLYEADFSGLTSLIHIGDFAFFKLKIALGFSSITSNTHIGMKAFASLE